MIQVSKHPPNELLERWKERYKNVNGRLAVYEDLATDHPAYDDVKRSLTDDQKGLCCYCCGPVSAGNSHIEHYYPKSPALYPHLDLQYENLFVSCNGVGGKPAESHCGHKKNNTDPTGQIHSPVSEGLYEAFWYTPTGKIEASGGDALSDSTIESLHLNHPVLVAARESALWNSGVLTDDEEEYAEFTPEDDSPPPFYNIIRYFAEHPIRES